MKMHGRIEVAQPRRLMKKSTFIARIVIVLAALAVASACVGVRVREGVRDADRYFDRAKAEIDRIQSEDPGRRGRVHEVCVLVHDRGSHELVEVRTPLWMAEACLGLAADCDRDWEREIRTKSDIDIHDLRHLDRFGPGLVVEINDPDSRVLVWLR
jgi:hypothetical protein